MTTRCCILRAQRAREGDAARTKQQRFHKEEYEEGPPTHRELVRRRKRQKSPHNEHSGVETAQHHVRGEQNEVLLVQSAHAIVHPGAVVVHPGNTVTAYLRKIEIGA